MDLNPDQYFYPSPGFSPKPFPYGQQNLDDTVYPTGDHLKGQFIHFETGQWAGRIIRAELRELQHADRGRKYADVDRRTLDPPPVVALRLFELVQTGPNYEEVEISSYEDVETIGLLCAAELIPVSEEQISRRITTLNQNSQNCARGLVFSQPVYSDMSSQCYINDLPECPYMRDYEKSLPSIPASPPSYKYGPAVNVAQLTDRILVGSKVVQPYALNVDKQKTLLFVFSDLAVRKTGLFRLRYRCFDLFSKFFGSSDTIIQAEYYGGMFRIFSTKTFPGLQESTTLTKALSIQGVPLNVRYDGKRRTKRRRRSYSPQTNGDKKAQAYGIAL
ncbi:hypothetical protein GYMLUDRAFT_43814 [Collybiopsis luxurians FD-317 M1]|uniref:Velvet domain-containing protein n=1 Tax=Collybiopsis luxurians FD-317 M1 TaxID=944289 RepID=A0A0D0CDF1_9AGAR|nr:hypothetical protein GYMLUDRAFT_43814 [Collybiopsis luxurians FD-317 M1]